MKLFTRNRRVGLSAVHQVETAIELDDLTVAARQETGLSQDDRDKAIYLLFLMLISITKEDTTQGDTLRIEMDADSYETWKQKNQHPRERRTFPNTAPAGQYALLRDNETRIAMKTHLPESRHLQTAWAWNDANKALRPLDSRQAELIVDGKTDTDPENMVVIEACRRLDPNFLLRYRSTMNYTGHYDISSLEKLHQEIVDTIPIIPASDTEAQEIPDLLGRTAYTLIFGDPKSNKPVPLKKTDRLQFVPIPNFGEMISIQPMHSFEFFGHDPISGNA